MSYRYIARRESECTPGRCSTCGERVVLIAVEQCKTVDRTGFAKDDDSTRIVCNLCGSFERQDWEEEPF